MFVIGDYIVHPMHGAGMIQSIISKRIDGDDRDYYVLKLPVGDMLVLIPVIGCESIGVRPIVSREDALGVLAAFPEIDTQMTQNWNKRYRENMLKIKSGNLYDVATVVKSLMNRELERGLSTGERKMLHSAKQIFVSELVVSLNKSYEEVEALISAAVS